MSDPIKTNQMPKPQVPPPIEAVGAGKSYSLLSKKTMTVALIALSLLAAFFISMPLFVVTAVSLAAAGTLTATVVAVKNVAAQRFGHKMTDQEEILAFHQKLLKEYSPDKSPISQISNPELERNIISNIISGLGSDIRRGAAYEIGGEKIEVSHNLDERFLKVRDKLIKFCDNDEDQAVILAFFLDQGELSPVEELVANLSKGSIRMPSESGYFGVIQKKAGNIEILFALAKTIGSVKDPFGNATQPQPIWACRKLLIPIDQLASHELQTISEQIFFIPRTTLFEADESKSSADILPSNSALHSFDKDRQAYIEEKQPSSVN